MERRSGGVRTANVVARVDGAFSSPSYCVSRSFMSAFVSPSLVSLPLPVRLSCSPNSALVSPPFYVLSLRSSLVLTRVSRRSYLAS